MSSRTSCTQAAGKAFLRAMMPSVCRPRMMSSTSEPASGSAERCWGVAVSMAMAPTVTRARGVARKDAHIESGR
jgi:hypothetical protein